MAAHGGALVEDLTFPYMAAIAGRSFFVWRNSWPINMTHTGVLVGKKWVLTAAHGPKDVRVRLKTFNLRQSNGKTVGVRRILSHPDYSDDDFHFNDIALLELESEVSGVEPVVMATGPEWRDLPGGLTCLGFGRNGSNGFDGRLRRRDVDLCADAACVAAFGASGQPRPDAHFCVSSPNSSADEGDSGGPILQLDSAGNPLLVGILSQSLLTAGQPDLCMDVGRYRPWIVDVMNNLQPRFKLLWAA